ncbi:MAG: N-acetylglutamate synthase-like GNAT family acetyltransferase [Psychroserpens sp.]|jgi:N-acetylglutamate synthase-like GNAT family acetyltransferase
MQAFYRNARYDQNSFMNRNISTSAYNVVKATKVDKKNIIRFYKNQQYSASYIGKDQCYIVKVNNIIIACAIISGGKKNDGFWLLHGLVIDKVQRGKSIASLILQTIITDKDEFTYLRYEQIICFADIGFQAFYQSNNFISYNTSENTAQLPTEFKQRFNRYREKQKNLHCFISKAV